MATMGAWYRLPSLQTAPTVAHLLLRLYGSTLAGLWQAAAVVLAPAAHKELLADTLQTTRTTTAGPADVVCSSLTWAPGSAPAPAQTGAAFHPALLSMPRTAAGTAAQLPPAKSGSIAQVVKCITGLSLVVAAAAVHVGPWRQPMVHMWHFAATNDAQSQACPLPGCAVLKQACHCWTAAHRSAMGCVGLLEHQLL